MACFLGLDTGDQYLLLTVLQTLQTLQNVWKEISLVRYYDCVVTGAREPDLWRNFTQPQYLMLWARHRGENMRDIDPISFLQQFVKGRTKIWNGVDCRLWIRLREKNWEMQGRSVSNFSSVVYFLLGQCGHKRWFSAGGGGVALQCTVHNITHYTEKTSVHSHRRLWHQNLYPKRNIKIQSIDSN